MFLHFDMDATDKPVKNVILMIGDGMGLAHICSGNVCQSRTAYYH